jgi:hypothetical protein
LPCLALTWLDLPLPCLALPCLAFPYLTVIVRAVTWCIIKFLI